MADNPKMKTLTIDGVTYEIYDEVARKHIANIGAKTADMTQPVGIDENGKLWTVPSAGGAGLTEVQIAAMDNLFKIAVYTEDARAAYEIFKLAFGITDSGGDGTHTHSYTSVVTAAATCTRTGIRTYTCSCGHSYTEVIPATGHSYVDGVCSVCGANDSGTEEPEVTLSSISATYSGGDVPVGTAVTELTGIVVTANYSDGTSEAVTGYTLSGSIKEGANNIMVSYGGKLTSFTVNGIPESEIIQDGSVLTIIAAPTVTQDGTALIIE